MDRNYELAELLIETAEELLNESSGRNGQVQRYYEERAKMLKKKNDEFDAKNEQKRKMYERAGYGDMAPQKADREDENDSRSNAWIIKRDKSKLNKIIKDKKNRYEDPISYKDYKNTARNLGRSNNTFKPEYLPENDFSHVDTSEGRRAAEAYAKQNHGEGKKIHKRINDRAKAQNESITDLLIEAAELLSGYDD